MAGGWLQGIKVYEWEDFNKMGKSKPSEAVPPKAGDPATIMYTSGTTGAAQANYRTNIGPVHLEKHDSCLLLVPPAIA